jgi:ribonucleoside-diphosphate reductase alpha chain
MPAKNADGANPTKTGTFLYQQDAPSCSDCGEIMVRNGACYKCLNCGSTSGCS